MCEASIILADTVDHETLNQQDTEEYPNQRGTEIGVFQEPKKGDMKWWEK